MKIKNIYHASVLVAVLFSCSKSNLSVEPVSKDQTKPGVITDIRVENFNGGANIIYSLPKSPNLLYVTAKYMINAAKSRETKASYYTDTITVDGFARSQDYVVTLHVVSRANVMSDPVTVTVHPALPNYLLVNSGLQVSEDFGGINISGSNKFKAPVSIHILSQNAQTNTYDELEPRYISTDLIDVSVRGFEPKPVKFGVYTSDKFGNVSDTLFKTVTPLLEVLLDKKKFYEYKLPGDTKIGYGWELRYFFDGNTTDPGWHTEPSGGAALQGTFGLGQNAKLSRFTLFERIDGVYGYANPKEFTLWASNSPAPGNTVLPLSSAEGTVSGDWVNIGNYKFPDPPSGLPPNQPNAQDVEFVKAGVNFNISINAPSARFIRFVVTKTWGGVDYSNLMEISFYGNPF